MKYDPQKHHRRSIRLKGYDYSRAGAYFITICTKDRACLFGEVVDGEIQLNDMGHMVYQEWTHLPNRFPNIDLDAFIAMPNHIHGIIVITDVDPVGAGLVPAQPVAQNDHAPTPSGAIPSGATASGATPSGATASGAIPSGATTRVAPTVGGIVGAFKSITTVRYTHGVIHYGWPPFPGRLWQRNYYEHIIRNEKSLNRIRQYIYKNPARWDMDRNNPHAIESEPEEPWLL